MKYLLPLFCIASLMGCDKPTAPAPKKEQAEVSSPKKDSRAKAPDEAPSKAPMVTLGGTITEIVFALGQGDRVVATDTSSTWPKDEVSKLPRVGYYRKLSSESILATSPKIILGYKEIGPPGVVEQLQGADLQLKLIPNKEGIDPAIARIREVASFLHQKERGEALVTKLKKDLETVAARKATVKEPARVLFIYARGPNVLMVSGTKTPAHEMITLAGAKNAAEGFEGFKPLTPEAVVAAQPTHLIMPAKGAMSIGGIKGVLALPGVGATPAGKEKRLITVDDLKLLGFGPRMGHALLELQDKLGIEAAQ